MPTYKPSDAVVEAKAMIKSMPIDSNPADANLQYKLVDQACATVWSSAPWWWSLGSIASVTITAATVDYTITVPNDFAYLHKVYLADANGVAPAVEMELVAFLPTYTQVSTPTQAAVVAKASYPTLDTLRVAPVPPTSFSQSAAIVYKRLPPAITSSNYSNPGAMVLPDAYFYVICAGVLYYAYLYADDERAGSATVDQDGKTQYTGQLGVFRTFIEEMKRKEKLLLKYPGVPVING